MTDAEWKYLESYIGKIRGLLKVSDWVIKVQREDPPDSNNEASTYILNDADEAHMRFNAHFRQWDANRQRAVVVHEVLHLHLDRLHDLAEQAFRGAAPHVWIGLEENHRRAYERVCERLAQSLAPMMPKIEWPK